MLLGTRSTLFCLPAIPSEVSSHSRLELCCYSSVINQSQRASKGQHTGPYGKTSWPLCGTAKRCRTQQASNATYRSTSRRVGVVRSSAVAAEQDIEFCSTTITEYLRQASVLRADAYYEVFSATQNMTVTDVHQTILTHDFRSAGTTSSALY